jgi:hypothetical protein
VSIRSYHSREYVQKTIFEQNRVCYDNKAQRQTLKRVGLYPSSPVFFLMASCMGHFPDLHLTTSLLQLLKVFGNVQKMTE